MPVVVTGADRPLGRAVVAALLRAGAAEVRATVRSRAAVADLAVLGVRVAVSDLVDPLRLGAVLEGAHTVIHLDDPAATWDYLLEAAEDTGLRRIVTVGAPGAGPPDPGSYDLVLVRCAVHEPAPALVNALVAADQRRGVTGVEVVDVGITG
ncbi:NAD(P)H-binding protein [Carbonactinospora thermoautotrophica]|uniref:NAD(P)H-binding protein n=1 Tax=Carbonactinospora thermoautotrophica TaxID=1469144 RepID=UPI00226E7F10|nr:NAD(P)H-binding protein [Carbonactinospora thermoautotrophica]